MRASKEDGPLVHIFVTCLLISSCNTQSSSECQTQQGRKGVCLDIKLCPSMLEMLLQNRTEQSDQFLRNSICERPQGTNVHVCCEQPSCATDEGQAGECMAPGSCVPIRRRSRNMTSRGTCRDSSRVCCPRRTFDGYVNRLSGLPEFGFCGVSEPVVSLKNGPTSPGQHPWTALLVYKIGSRETELCGGTLISSRFVLTAAHCTDNPPIKVRLGVTDIRERCTDVRAGCPFEASVINYTALPTFEQESHKDDIGLVVMGAPAPYTKHIRPICLPDRRIMESLSPLTLFATSGWGVSQELAGDQLRDGRKNQTLLPLRNSTVCRNAMVLWADLLKGQVPVDTSLPPNAVCAGGTFSSELCVQDSGGALVWTPPVHTQSADTGGRPGPSTLSMVYAVHTRSAAGCKAPVPAVYTPVLPHTNFIVRIIADYYNISWLGTII